MSRDFLHTHYKIKKTIQSSAGTTIPQGNTQNVQSTMSAPGSGRATTGQPEHLADIPIGIRFGRIDKIKVDPHEVYRYHVVFYENTEVWARMLNSNFINIDYAGRENNGIIYLSSPIDVALSIELNSFRWVIVGESLLQTHTGSGSININNKNMAININESSIILQDNKKKIEIKEEEINLGFENSKIEIKNDSINIITPDLKINGVSFND